MLLIGLLLFHQSVNALVKFNLDSNFVLGWNYNTTATLDFYFSVSYYAVQDERLVWHRILQFNGRLRHDHSN